MPKVSFIHNEVNSKLTNRKELKAFIATLFTKEKKTLGSITYVFCSDAYLLQMNKAALQHDFYTDIITFDLSETKQVIAEVYISVDRVRDNAGTFKASYNEELHRVIFHGALHLCGYKDKTKQQKEVMRLIEDKYLVSYFK